VLAREHRATSLNNSTIVSKTSLAATYGERQPTPSQRRDGRPAAEVFLVFLKLGLTSFGGPIAHIGYFHGEFVVRRKWLSEAEFADLVALCQVIPGPASSQVGIAVGLLRSGYAGALAAWSGFTLPSAVIMVLFAYGANALTGSSALALLHGLRLVAVAIVAQAVWGMAHTLSRGAVRTAITVVSALISILIHSGGAQLTVIALGATLGWLFCRDGHPDDTPPALRAPVSKCAGVLAFGAFLTLLIAPPLISSVVSVPGLPLFDAFYRSGALVFGGGHVVLPLLREAFVSPGWVTDDAFLAGYGAAQAIPGPLFTLAAYLGALAHQPPQGLPGAALGLVSIFLPGFLILLASLPYWYSLRRHPGAQALMSGTNAAVVGILAAALYRPLWTTSVVSPGDVALVLVGVALLAIRRIPRLLVVAFLATAAAVLGILGGLR
jgi:chromate transporter